MRRSTARLTIYARKLAANMNHGYEIDARVPSILSTNKAGGSNFPYGEREIRTRLRDKQYAGMAVHQRAA